MSVTTTSEEPRTALAVRGLSKAFGSTLALNDFSFEVRRGEVHALVGGNGSGKSTFIKVLAGVHQGDAGEIETFRGGHASLVSFTPEDAHRAGLRFVHQNYGIVPAMSIMDNLALGHGYPTGPGKRIRWRQWKAECRATLKRFGIDASPDDSAQALSTPNVAMLAVARVLHDLEHVDQAILVFDEPSAALPQREAQALLRSIRELADQGAAIILVTHRLEEVQLVADRVTAVRDGIFSGTRDARSMTHGAIVELLLGHSLAVSGAVTSTRATGSVVVELRGVTSGPLRGIDLQVREGECVGIAGLLGSGRTELLELMFGIRPVESGEVSLAGDAVRGGRPARMKAAGVAIVPEDRISTGVFDGFSVAENMTVGHLGRYFRRGWLRDRELEQDVQGDLGTYRVKCSSAHAPIATLSGGNQQKVVLGRWLREDPRLLLLDEPTQGIDVGAREEIYELLSRARDRGTATVLVSSEFEELTRLCDRIVILTRGEISGEVDRGTSAHDLFETVLTNQAATRVGTS